MLTRLLIVVSLLLLNNMTIQDISHDHRIVEAMSKYGGSFAKAIAKAALLADEHNYNKLKQAFPELWERYESFVFINNDN